MLESVLFSGLKQVRLGTIALASALAVFSPMAYSAILTAGSVLNISGTAIMSPTALTFLCNEPGDPLCVQPPAGDGDFAVASSSGSFAQYTGTFGLIKNINNAAEPLNQPFSLPDWITFDLNNEISLELAFLPLGTDPASSTCIGLAHCTPTNNVLVTASNPVGLSGFNLDQTVTGTNVSFFVQGIAHASDATTSPFFGVLTETFTGLTPAQTLAAMLAGTERFYSGNITLTAGAAAAPEPASLALVGVGLGALSLSRRRRYRAPLQ